MWLFTLLAWCLVVQPVWAREGLPSAGSLSAEERAEVLDSLNNLLVRHYVFPDIAAQLVEVLNNHRAAEKYARYTEKDAFASAVTDDLRSVNNDKHLSVWVTPDRTAEDETNLGSDFSRARGAFSNYGFERAEVLPGNIGYLKLSSFSLDQLYEPAQRAGAAAMAFVADVDALVFDLTDNGGGSPRLSRFISSYLFTREPVHLNDFYFRTSDTTLEYWTLDDIPGKRMPDVAVYILINKNTFSAAEGFAYSLKHLGRATVIGQASGGGSHGGSTHDVTNSFQAYIPFSRSIHPVTKTDFEGVGVLPDVSINSGDPLLAAHTLAIENLMTLETEPEKNKHYENILAQLNLPSTPVELDETTLLSYAGKYQFPNEQQFTLSIRGSRLFGQMTGDPEAVAVEPISETRFRATGYGVEFTIKLDTHGQVVGLTIHQGDGIQGKRVH